MSNTTRNNRSLAILTGLVISAGVGPAVARAMTPNQFDTTVPRTWLCDGAGCVQYVGYGLNITGTSGATASSCTIGFGSEPYWYNDDVIESECLIDYP
ncbi:MAG TPA: hypothetical protein VFN22_03490 [Gemmatimonadales bacterium]|nr:hypothetical protein [Gemmatimonadales bacterium]